MSAAATARNNSQQVLLPQGRSPVMTAAVNSKSDDNALIKLWKLSQALVLAASCSGVATAANLYVGYQHTPQTSVLGTQSFDFDATGMDVYGAVSVTEQVDIGIALTALNNTNGELQGVSANLDTTTTVVNTRYTAESYGVSVSYLSWDDDLDITANNNRVVAAQRASGDVFTISGNRVWSLDSWQLGVGISLSHGDWDQTSDVQRQSVLPFEQILEDGRSSFVSVEISADHYLDVSPDHTLLLGLSTGWNQVLESDASLALPSSRQLSQRNLNRLNRFASSQQVTGTDSYGQVNGYISWYVGANWSIELTVNQLLSVDQIRPSWSAGVGYVF